MRFLYLAYWSVFFCMTSLFLQAQDIDALRQSAEREIQDWRQMTHLPEGSKGEALDFLVFLIEEMKDKTAANRLKGIFQFVVSTGMDWGIAATRNQDREEKLLSLVACHLQTIRHQMPCGSTLLAAGEVVLLAESIQALENLDSLQQEQAWQFKAVSLGYFDRFTGAETCPISAFLAHGEQTSDFQRWKRFWRHQQGIDLVEAKENPRGKNKGGLTDYAREALFQKARGEIISLTQSLDSNVSQKAAVAALVALQNLKNNGGKPDYQQLSRQFTKAIPSLKDDYFGTCIFPLLERWWQSSREFGTLGGYKRVSSVQAFEAFLVYGGQDLCAAIETLITIEPGWDEWLGDVTDQPSLFKALQKALPHVQQITISTVLAAQSPSSSSWIPIDRPLAKRVELEKKGVRRNFVEDEAQTYAIPEGIYRFLEAFSCVQDKAPFLETILLREGVASQSKSE